MATTRVTRKGDLTSQPPDTPLGVSEVETIVEKAVKAAVQVVRDEFQKLYDNMIERLELLEGRLDAVESTVADTVSHAGPNSFYYFNYCYCWVDCKAGSCTRWDKTNSYGILRISRTWSATGEECRTVVAEFIRKHMHLAVSMEDIETAHTVTSVKNQGTTGATSTRPYIPPIVVRFRQRSMRDNVIQHRKDVKNSNITIVEDLTNLNLELMIIVCVNTRKLIKHDLGMAGCT